MVMVAERRRTRFRDHRTFWLGFVVLLLTALLLAASMYLAFGLSSAALVLLAECSLALALGFR